MSRDPYSLPGYDEWKLRSPDDDYAMRHPEKYRRGVYTVTVIRRMVATIEVEIEAGSEEDARFDAVIKARGIPLDKWDLADSMNDDEFDTGDVEGPPERDPDDARDERMDREMDR